MLAQRGPLAVPAPGAAKPRRAATVTKPQLVSRPRKMTFRDRHLLEALPAKIAALQDEIARLHAALADAELYRRDPAQFAAMTKALAVAQNGLADAEEQWLSLEMLREELES